MASGTETSAVYQGRSYVVRKNRRAAGSRTATAYPMAMIVAPHRPYQKPESRSPAWAEVRPETVTSRAAASGPVTG
ncbi:hypothetical protein Acy02nite_70660 [Actinoplanes cyaneus]|uniref:Uncharacterized protein n=1 Tax=Actinoplanes cyaneus TaxID=52696 RepID=A0A919M4B0_9ACTN|nr:hypothetical protein Acy02nite_70660 [Actinoplanes cyaneus]